MGSSLSTADIADHLGTTGRALRKFLRSSASPYQPVGQGARYNIDSDDLVDLKERYETWVTRPGSRSASDGPKTDAPRKTGKRSKKAPDKVDPLENDGDLMFRLTHTVADRQRLAGVICSYEWHHPKVKGLDIKCTGKPVKDTKYCSSHTQVKYCGDIDTPVDDVCGPGGKNPKPYCEWHNAELSIEDLDEYLTAQGNTTDTKISS
jgi:hypothetical protein